MFGLQEILESTIEEMLATGHLDQHPDNDLESSVTDMIPGLSSDIASLILVRGKPRAVIWDKICELFTIEEVATAVSIHLKATAKNRGRHEQRS